MEPLSSIEIEQICHSLNQVIGALNTTEELLAETASQSQAKRLIDLSIAKLSQLNNELAQRRKPNDLRQDPHP